MFAGTKQKRLGAVTTHCMDEKNEKRADTLIYNGDKEVKLFVDECAAFWQTSDNGRLELVQNMLGPDSIHRISVSRDGFVKIVKSGNLELVKLFASQKERIGLTISMGIGSAVWSACQMAKWGT